MARDSERGEYETDVSPGEESVVLAILRTVAAIDGEAITDLPCFEHELSTEGLEAVIASSDDVEVSFPYAGYDVTVRGDGTIAVRERT